MDVMVTRKWQGCQAEVPHPEPACALPSFSCCQFWLCTPHVCYASAACANCLPVRQSKVIHGLRLRSLRKLGVVEVRIESLFCEELFMGPLLDDVSVIQDKDQIRIADG